MLHPLRLDIDQRATHFGLKVNYNMTLFEVYREIVLGSIAESYSLQVLSHAIEDAKHREGYPTWMPLWHATGSHFTRPRRTFLYNASRKYKPQLCAFTNPMLLGLGGVIIGTVTKTSTNIILSDSKVPQAQDVHHGTTLTEIQEISRLLVRDCWQPEHNGCNKQFIVLVRELQRILKTFVLSLPRGCRRRQGPLSCRCMENGVTSASQGTLHHQPVAFMRSSKFCIMRAARL